MFPCACVPLFVCGRAYVFKRDGVRVGLDVVACGSLANRLEIEEKGQERDLGVIPASASRAGGRVQCKRADGWRDRRTLGWRDAESRKLSRERQAGRQAATQACRQAGSFCARVMANYNGRVGPYNGRVGLYNGPVGLYNERSGRSKTWSGRSI